MEEIYYRPKESPKGTPFKEGFAIFSGIWVEIGHYPGSTQILRYKACELEIIRRS